MTKEKYIKDIIEHGRNRGMSTEKAKKYLRDIGMVDNEMINAIAAIIADPNASYTVTFAS